MTSGKAKVRINLPVLVFGFIILALVASARSQGAALPRRTVFVFRVQTWRAPSCLVLASLCLFVSHNEDIV